jgi:hypothetical protein
LALGCVLSVERVKAAHRARDGATATRLLDATRFQIPDLRVDPLPNVVQVSVFAHGVLLASPLPNRGTSIAATAIARDFPSRP